MEKETRSVIRQTCRKFNHDGTRIIDILREVQKRLGCICEETMELLAAELSTYRIEIEGLVSFYSFFSEKQKGKIIIRLCDDIIDRFAGIERVAKVFSEELGLASAGPPLTGIFLWNTRPVSA